MTDVAPHWDAPALLIGRKPMSLENQTILIVDSDDDPFASDLKGALQRAGADVLIARDALAALAFLAGFELSAALIGGISGPAESYHELIKGLRGVPFRLYDVTEGVPTIVAAVTRMIGHNA